LCYSPHLRLEKEQNYFANSVHFIALQALSYELLKFTLIQEYFQ
ncbi:MAG: hypothetical protein PWP52_1080, partial [Bacteroidales bacterium]|nr:hypothetical protein [Bacteroidales bacterium]